MSPNILIALLTTAGATVGQSSADLIRERPPVITEGRTSRYPEPRPDVVLRWNETTLKAIRVEKTPPPVAARNLAIVHAAIYDAVNAVYRTHRPYLVDVQAGPGTSAEAAATSAAYQCLTYLYPRGKRLFDDMYVACQREVVDADARERGMRLGEHVAGRILEARARDNSDFSGKHVWRRFPGAWQPTLPDYREALLPRWGHVMPFAIRPGSQPRPPGPPSLSSAAYLNAYREVKLLGGKDSLVRTADQTEIARFWVDDVGTSTPPGHWNLIAQDVALAKGGNLAENARLFALLNFSLADAGLLCWVIKFHHDFWRPVTAIRLAADDGVPDTDPDPNWEPLIRTPPFPAYTSGHSTFSGAGSRVLEKFYGSDTFAFETTSEGLPGVRRSFIRFSQAADEAGRSRIYGGIHWEFDNADGLAMGRAIADFVCRQHLLAQPK